jgi:HK97 family phage major capsid protein
MWLCAGADYIQLKAFLIVDKHARALIVQRCRFGVFGIFPKTKTKFCLALYAPQEIYMSAIEQEYKQVQADLKKVGDELRTYAEQSQTEIKKHSKMSEEVKSSVDGLLVKQGELNARLLASEQLIAKLEGDFSKGPAQPRSIGEQVVAHEDFLTYAKRGKGDVSFEVKAAANITSDNASNGDIVRPDRVPGIFQLPNQRLTIRDLLTWGRTASNAVEFVRETAFDNGADVVSENPSGEKPKSDFTTEVDSAAVATVAHHITATKQILSDFPMMMSYINGRLQYGLKLKEESQLLKGSGSGLNMHGIYTQAAAYSQPSGAVVEFETAVDRLRLAMLQSALAEYAPDGIVLSLVDWANIELTKDGDKNYIFTAPATLRGPTLWGLPVVATNSMDAGDFLVGAFAMGAQGWDREDMRITLSDSHDKNFTKNLVTVLCEERLALTVYRPDAFIKGDFDGLPASE